MSNDKNRLSAPTENRPDHSGANRSSTPKKCSKIRFLLYHLRGQPASRTFVRLLFLYPKRRIRLWREPRRRKKTSCPVAATACRCTLTPMRTEKSITNPLQRHQKSWRRPQPGCAVMDQRPLRKAVTQNSMQRLRSPGTGSGHVRPRSASQGHPPAAAETRALLPK